MHRIRPIVASLLVAAAVLAPWQPLQAQEACDLIDEYGLDDPVGVRAAVQAAEAETGLDFFVYAVDRLPPSSNVNAELAAAARGACTQAFDGPANVADGTVLLAVSIGDRWTAVSYGDDLDERLDDDVDDIVNRMNAFFASGEISAGLSSGVGGVVEGVDTVPPDYATPIGTGVATTAVVVGGGAWLWTRRRTRRGRAAESARLFELASDRITTVQARWFDAEQEATLVGGSITGGAMVRLDAAQLAAAQTSRSLYEAWSPVDEITPDDVMKMDDDEQAQLKRQTDAATGEVEDAEAAVAVLEQITAELRGKPDELRAQHQVASEQIATGLNAADARAAEGWEVSSGRERLAQLSAELQSIDTIAVRLDVDQVEAELVPIAAETERLTADLSGLEDRWTGMQTRRDEMTPEIEGQRGRVLQMQGTMRQWAAEHATASFEELLGHPGEADRELERALRALLAAQQITPLPRDLGIMLAVDRELEAAQNALDLADELLDECDEMDVLLASARANSAEAVRAAGQDAQYLTDYVRDHRRDVPSKAPQIAQRVLELQNGAVEALQASPPDHLLAMELAGRVESIVNTELDDFKSEVGKRERLRRQAASELRSADLAIQRADRHVSSHFFSSRADKNGQGKVDVLRQRLRSANKALSPDPERALKEAKSIEQLADDIYREAQRRQRHRNGGGFGGGIVVGGGGFRGHGGGRRHRGGGWGGGGGGGFGSGFGGGSSGGWGGGGGGFGGGSGGGW